MIRGGYILQARQTDDSDIAHKPPHFREIFNWLYRQANHQESPDGRIKRGQCLRSIKDIQEGLSWYVGYRKHKYTKDQCEKALKWLRKETMIATTKATRGMFITICKYDFYQDPQNYESNNGATTKATRKQQGSRTINKNEKNDKNDKLLDREKNFRDTLTPFVDIYGEEMMREFYNYWREPNKSKTKMRWELQKTWDVTLRLKTWERNQERFHK